MLDTDYLMKECDELCKEDFDVYNKLYISDACHIILPLHGIIDAHREKILLLELKSELLEKELEFAMLTR